MVSNRASNRFPPVFEAVSIVQSVRWLVLFIDIEDDAVYWRVLLRSDVDNGVHKFSRDCRSTV